MKRFTAGFVVAALLIGAAVTVAQQFNDLIARRLCLGSALATCNTVRSGTGSPQTVVTGKVGDLFLRSDGGTDTTLYVKESGTGTSGWRAMSSAAVGTVDRLSNAALTTVSSPADGDVWFEATGSSPSRVVSLKLRDGGSTVTLQSWTY